MTARDYAYWLQSFFEVGNSDTLNVKQTETIKNTLRLVFKHELLKQANKDNSLIS